MASLFKQRRKYYLQFYDQSRNPKRKRVALKVTRKREAKKLQQQLEAAYREQKFDPWTDDPFTLQAKEQAPTTLPDALEAFLRSKKRAGRSENTIRSYRGIVGRLIKRVGGERQLRDIAPADIERYIRDETVARTTQHKRYRHLKAFFRWCVKEELATLSPLRAVEPPGRPQTLPKVMSEDPRGHLRRDTERL